MEARDDKGSKRGVNDLIEALFSDDGESKIFDGGE